MGIARGWEKRVIRTNTAYAKRTVRIFSVFPQSRSLFSALFETFCLTARAYLNTQKYGLFCSLLCDQTGKRHSFVKHNEEYEKYASLNNSHRNHTNRIFYKNIFRSIDQSILASFRTHAMNLCASLGIFMCQGCRTQR